MDVRAARFFCLQALFDLVDLSEFIMIFSSCALFGRRVITFKIVKLLLPLMRHNLEHQGLKGTCAYYTMSN